MMRIFSPAASVLSQGAALLILRGAKITGRSNAQANAELPTFSAHTLTSKPASPSALSQMSKFLQANIEILENRTPQPFKNKIQEGEQKYKQIK